MFTTPKVCIPKNTNDRVYIAYYFDGKRQREYNANRLNLNINPNQFNSIDDRDRLLIRLQFEFTKALNKGWNPFAKENEKPSLKFALDTILEEKQNSNLCDGYKRNLKTIHRMFCDFLTVKELNSKADELELQRVEVFLNRFQTSERNYINRRRQLGTLFNEMVRKDYADKNAVKHTKPARAKATLHAPYSDAQLKNALDYLKEHNPKLHLCCILTYGCLLRPHQEIRLLKRKHIVKDFTEIHLSGSENKSKRIRTAYIPGYIKELLKERLQTVTDMDVNIFTLTNQPYNITYFNLMWLKASKKMRKAGIIEPKQTIYSFRHTAAINVYKKTKDLHVLQQLLQHSNMIVTLNYLRGLGELNDERLREVLPEL
ncbi:site-specific integrase [Mucilaginibacter panaciglaebae]|uniref:Tyr recombinase domain-containing protein n=1 Tax=Mucilaginibacter panaciglaebae TaxID=502331 RepID=A0ABP7WYY5_9SPHI